MHLRGFACFLCRVITYTLPHILQPYAGYSLFRVAFYAGCLFFVTFAFFPLSFHPAYYCNSQQVVILRSILSLRKVLLSDLSPYCPCLDFFVAIPHRILFLLTVHIYRCIDNTSIYFPVAFYAGYSTPSRITFR